MRPFKKVSLAAFVLVSACSMSYLIKLISLHFRNRSNLSNREIYRVPCLNANVFLSNDWWNDCAWFVPSSSEKSSNINEKLETWIWQIVIFCTPFPALRICFQYLVLLLLSIGIRFFHAVKFLFNIGRTSRNHKRIGPSSSSPLNSHMLLFQREKTQFPNIRFV